MDPQLGVSQDAFYPAASILAAAAIPNPNRDDSTLIMADMARKAITQVFQMVNGLLKDKGMSDEAAETLARTLSEGRWTHDYPIMTQEARQLGLNVSEEMPMEHYQPWIFTRRQPSAAHRSSLSLRLPATAATAPELARRSSSRGTMLTANYVCCEEFVTSRCGSPAGIRGRGTSAVSGAHCLATASSPGAAHSLPAVHAAK